MPLKTYDESLNFLRTALDRAKLGSPVIERTEKKNSKAFAGSNALFARWKTD